MRLRKNMYIRYGGILFLCMMFIVGSLVWAIEHHFSRRVTYAHEDVIRSERKKMIELYGTRPVTFKTEDHKNIAALYVIRPHAKRILLICHGFKRAKEHMAKFLDIFSEDSLMFIDFRGHGESDGDCVTLGLHEYLDVIAATDFIKRHISSTLPIFAIGISMGGSAVLRAAASGAPFDGVISDSAPSSFKDTIAYILQDTRHIPFILAWLALTLYELKMGHSFSLSCYKNFAHLIQCPVLLIHDLNDELIPFYHAENIYKTLGTRCKKLQKMNHSMHGKIFKQFPERYKACIEDFIISCT